MAEAPAPTTTDDVESDAPAESTETHEATEEQLAAAVAAAEADEQPEKLAVVGENVPAATAKDTKSETPEQANEPADEAEDVDEEDLRAQLAKAQAELAEIKTHAAKVDVLGKAGIGEQYARLLSGDQESWGEQINLLLSLRGDPAPATSVQRDPAVDSDPAEDEEGARESYARRFLGVD